MLAPAAAPLRAGDEIGGLRAPAGFEVTQFAGDELAHDIYSMTVNARGEVVVSGAGYVRALLDTDGDGQADETRQFADGPKTGAQGMHFDGPDLICTGDAGLIRYRDADGDGKADGPAETLLKMKAGGEHHAHAVRKGPDGWWYVLCGNMTGIDESYVTLPTSPVKKPEAGVLLRIKPDFSASEVVSHGYRNPYDFAFHPAGDAFVYDSDGERDVSLPWYRPTRVFMALPGSHAGWVSRSWKRPDYYPDMPPVVGRFGRGSPTGVECYRHVQFPEVYRDAIFIADWTFGRVIALPLERDGSVFKCDNPIDFLTATGDFGFAPTDLAVAPDGSLLVSVGGRGTKGGVYRVRWKDAEPWTWPEPKTDEEKLSAVLSAPQPLSSWSRAKWEPWAEELGTEAFAGAPSNRGNSENSLIRAIEVLTENADPLKTDSLAGFVRSNNPQVRARAAWALGRATPDTESLSHLSKLLRHPTRATSRAAAEALLGGAWSVERGWADLIVPLTEAVKRSDRFVWMAASRVLGRHFPARALAYDADGENDPFGFSDSAMAHSLAQLRRWCSPPEGQSPLAGVIRSGSPLPAAGVSGSREDALVGIRAVQLALGDLGRDTGVAPVFDGYHVPKDLDKEHLDAARERFRLTLPNRATSPSVDPVLRHEYARLCALLRLDDRPLYDRLLSALDAEPDPVEQIHLLIVTACMPVDRTNGERKIVAKALVNLEPKIAVLKLNIDSNWDDRVGEMYAAHLKLDPWLSAEIVQQEEFGEPGHVLFLRGMPQYIRREALAAFVRRIEADADYAWSPEIVALLAESGEERHRELLRGQFDNYSVRGAVLRALAKRPEPQDRERFVAGLKSPETAVIAASLAALEELGPDQSAAEQFALLQLARRLGADRAEYELRERAVKLLRRSTGDFGFVTGSAGHNPQRDALARWEDYLRQRWPDEARALLADAGAGLASFAPRLAEAAELDGDATRGERVFETRACARCHGGRRAVGPDLAGVTQRFSRDDLFTAILAPDRDVSPRYATTTILTTSGKSYTGLVVYESVDGLLLRDANGETIRIERDQIERRRRLTKSLMPAGLLKDAPPRDLADLLAYLRTLGS